jgi:PPOX class probable F420-dependent enzyme
MGQARVARLATVGSDGSPHLVPIVLAAEGDRIWFAVDHKPKGTTALRRLANIRADPRVAVLADAYEGDWTRLWWVRAEGTATVLEAGDPLADRGLDLLVAKYPQYADRRPGGPVVVIEVHRWSGWSAAGRGG